MWPSKSIAFEKILYQTPKKGVVLGGSVLQKVGKIVGAEQYLTCKILFETLLTSPANTKCK